MRLRLAVALLLAMTGDSAIPAQQDALRFIGCPIYRDTDAGRKSGCWLADDAASGRRFDISAAPTKPDWNFEVLVEGRIAASQPNSCGGTVLDPVRVSVLPGACTRHLLPAENYPGNRYVLPLRNVRPLSEPRPQPEPPHTERTFHLLFDFNKAFVIYQLDDYLLDQAITYIRATQPRSIAVTGWAATTPAVVSGRRIFEDPQIARVRAQVVRDALIRLGVPGRTIEVNWHSSARTVAADGADGLLEPSRRRVDVVVRP